jgi:hypothetical protein
MSRQPASVEHHARILAELLFECGSSIGALLTRSERTELQDRVLDAVAAFSLDHPTLAPERIQRIAAGKER